MGALQERTNSDNGLVSIITPMYNAERFIDDTIQSVLLQTYPHWEMLIIDNGSADSSLVIAQRYAYKDARIKVFEYTEKKGFPCYTRNVGIEHANGKYIAFLDSDDLWNPDKLLLQVRYLQQHPACNIVCGAYEKINQDGVSENRVVKPRKTVGYKQLLMSNSIGNLTAMYDQEKLGKYFQKPIYHEDYLMWLNILRCGEIAHGIENVVAKYRIHNRSVSNSKFKMMSAQWHIYRRELRLDLFSSAYYFICYSFLGLQKHLV